MVRRAGLALVGGHMTLIPMAHLFLTSLCSRSDLPACHPSLHYARPLLSLPRILADNAQRRNASLAFLHSYSGGQERTQHLFHAQTVVGLVAAPRPVPANALQSPPDFTIQTGGRLLQLLDRQNDYSHVPFLCLGSGAEKLLGPQLAVLRPHIRVIESTEPEPSSDAKRKWKELLDYAFCLRRALKLSKRAEYILLLEDDAYPHPDFFLRLEAIKARLRFLQTKNPGRRSPAYVKLHHPNALRGLPWVLQAILAGVVLSAAGVTALSYALGMESGGSRPLLLLLFCLQTSWWVVVQAELGPAWAYVPLLGRRYLGLEQLGSAESCCTAGVLFPREGALAVLAALEAAKETDELAKDTVMDNLPGLLTGSNLLAHIGSFSTLHSVLIQPDPIPLSPVH